MVCKVLALYVVSRNVQFAWFGRVCLEINVTVVFMMWRIVVESGDLWSIVHYI